MCNLQEDAEEHVPKDDGMIIHVFSSFYTVPIFPSVTFFFTFYVCSVARVVKGMK